jgi:NADH:ubiquinone oxidoreductase subunit 3 (subunit A)
MGNWWEVNEYWPIAIYILIAGGLGILIIGISYMLATRVWDVEKISAYECGFEPFEDARNKYDVKFYLVAILFIIFDLEVVYLIPGILVINWLDMGGIIIMNIFILILVAGFVYEWRKGALNW